MHSACLVQVADWVEGSLELQHGGSCPSVCGSGVEMLCQQNPEEAE